MLASILFNWWPENVAAEDIEVFVPTYICKSEATMEAGSVRMCFGYMLSFDIWADYLGTDGEVSQRRKGMKGLGEMNDRDWRK